MRNQSAFPIENKARASQYGEFGMTLRDYFAAKAMLVVIERWTKDAIKDGEPSLLEMDGAPTDLAHCIAQEIYAMADAMMLARK